MRNKNILIIEDNIIFANALKAKIKKANFNVCGVANSAEEAIDIAINEEPDLILMDIRLKGEMDGVTVAELLNSKYNLPTVFLTATYDDEVINRAQKANPLGYIIKPIDEQNFIITIKMALNAAVINKKNLKLLEQVSRSEESFRVLTENIWDVLIITDTNGDITYVSSNTHSSLGYSHLEIVKIRSIKKLFGDILFNPDQFDFGNEIQNVEREFTDREGQIRHLLINIKKIDLFEGDILYSIRDISKLKNTKMLLRESENKIRAIFDVILATLVLVDEKGYILDFNKAFADTVAIASNQLKGLNLWGIYKSDEYKLLKTNLEVALSTKMPVRFNNMINQRYYDIIIYAISDDDSKYSQAAIFSEDITEDHQKDMELRKKEAMLLQSQKMETIGTLVSGIAHEINNPLNLISFNVPMILDIWKDVFEIIKEDKNNHLRKYGGFEYEYIHDNFNGILEDLKFATSRARSLTSYLKDFTCFDKNLRIDSVNVNTAINNSIRLAATITDNSAMKIEIDLSKPSPIIQGHMHSLEQIILNLIVNAIQASDKEDNWVKVSSGFDQDNKLVFIELADNGHGIDPKIQSRIFDPFFTTKFELGGTGLGLPIAYSLVKSLGGSIDLSSEAGKGTTIRILFPKINTDLKILIADDDLHIRGVLQEYLYEIGFTKIYESENGDETLLKIGLLKPDILILDLVMPNMDGLEVVKAVLNTPELSNTNILVITGHAYDERIQKLHELNIKNILFKPFDPEDIYNYIKEIS